MKSAERIVIVISNEAFRSQIEYTFDQLLLPLGIKYEAKIASGFDELGAYSLVVSYGKNRPCVKAKQQLHIYESNLFGEKYLEEESLPERPLPRFEDLPVIYSGNGKLNSLVERSKDLIETNIDIIASSFFMLTRYEEVLLDERDKFDRFPATASLAYSEGFLERPIVNEYVELLWNWIDSSNLGFKRRELWGGKKFAVCLTHDVDRLRLYNRVRHVLGTILRTVIKRKQPSNLVRIARDCVKTWLGLQKDPYDQFETMLELEQEFGARASFYFMSGGSARRYDNRYHIENVRDLIRSISDAGCEIGLHGSFNSYIKPQMMLREKVKLEEISGSGILGNRQHYLRWETPKTWRVLEEAGLKYDTSLSFADHAGFRCGICYPYKPFDILENRVLDIWEVPLIVMEGSLFGYQNLAPEEGLKEIQTLIDTVERYRGVFITLWHNSSFYELESPEMLEIYKQMLDYIGNKNALCSTVEGVLANWIKVESR